MRGLLFGLVFTLACSRELESRAITLTGGDPERGREEIAEHGCGTCHTIPGVRGAHALVGPPLEHMAKRSYLAGTLANTPDNMRAWLMHPQQVKPGNAMPELGIGDLEARHISAYLYTLE